MYINPPSGALSTASAQASRCCLGAREKRGAKDAPQKSITRKVEMKMGEMLEDQTSRGGSMDGKRLANQLYPIM